MDLLIMAIMPKVWFLGWLNLLDPFESGYGFENVNFNDFFNEEFIKEKKKANKKGKDIILSLEISFLESIQGVQKTISYSRLETCSTCKGSKCSPGTSPSNCKTCFGTGELFFKQGNMNIGVDCHTCNGEGFKIENPCNINYT